MISSAVPAAGSTARVGAFIQTVGAMPQLSQLSQLSQLYITIARLPKARQGACQHAMTLLRDVGSLYSVGTLDTRFTTSSNTPPSHIDSAKSPAREARLTRNGSQKQYSAASPSRWKTPEFLYHYLIFLIVVPWMFYTVFDVSQRKRSRSSKPLALSELIR